ncbi:hypothetical protein ACOI1H_21425 [Loktanella sp. DJP18]|uniref:hypothetical protein n=1 Tax=Loktanella sp. DJP18 TaxID=3409788 RepID=UPI003BB48FE7
MKSIHALSNALEIFRQIYPDIPATTIMVFLQVVIRPGISSRDTAEAIGSSQSAISRHFSMLGEYTWRGEEGWGLVDLIEEPTNRRMKVAFLTSKGQALAEKIAVAIDPTGRSLPPAETADAYVRRVRGQI